MRATVNIPKGVKTLTEDAPLDAKRYNDAGTPYLNVAQANEQNPIGTRELGLTVFIGVDEYWWKESKEDYGLVLKTLGGSTSGDATEESLRGKILEVTEGIIEVDFDEYAQVHIKQTGEVTLNITPPTLLEGEATSRLIYGDLRNFNVNLPSSLTEKTAGFEHFNIKKENWIVVRYSMTNTGLEQFANLTVFPFSNSPDIINDPTTQFIDLGDIGIVPVSDAFNAYTFTGSESPVQSTRDGHVIVRAISRGIPVEFLFLGDGGDYGVGGTLTAYSYQFILITDILNDPSTQFIEIGEIGDNLIEGVINSHVPCISIQSQINGYVVINIEVHSIPFQYFFVGNGGSYGDGCPDTAIAEDFVEFQPYIEPEELDQTWTKADSQFGNTGVVSKLNDGDIYHNGILSVQGLRIPTNTGTTRDNISTIGYGPLTISGNYGIRFGGGNPNHTYFHFISEGIATAINNNSSKIGLYERRDFRSQAVADNYTAVGFQANDYVDLSKQTNSRYASFRSNPIVSGTGFRMFSLLSESPDVDLLNAGDVYFPKIKAAEGKTHKVTIDEDGKLSSTEDTGGTGLMSLILEYGITGVIDGNNTVFNTLLEFIPNTLKVWVTGVMLYLDEDFTVSNNQEITFINPPEVGNEIIVEYQIYGNRYTNDFYTELINAPSKLPIDDSDIFLRLDATDELKLVKMTWADIKASLPSSAGDSLTADNGLTIDLDNIKLGGSLTESTNINGSGDHGINFYQITDFKVGTVFEDSGNEDGSNVSSSFYQNPGRIMKSVYFNDRPYGKLNGSVTLETDYNDDVYYHVAIYKSSNLVSHFKVSVNGISLFANGLYLEYPSTYSGITNRNMPVSVEGNFADTSGNINLYEGAAPATPTSTGVKGQIRFDDDYMYRCIATNTWKRTSLSTW